MSYIVYKPIVNNLQYLASRSDHCAVLWLIKHQIGANAGRLCSWDVEWKCTWVLVACQTLSYTHTPTH